MDLYGLGGTAYPLMEGNYVGRSTSRRVTRLNTALCCGKVFYPGHRIGAPVCFTLSVALKEGDVCLFFTIPFLVIQFACCLTSGRKAAAVNLLEVNGLERQLLKKAPQLFSCIITDNHTIIFTTFTRTNKASFTAEWSWFYCASAEESNEAEKISSLS